MPRPILPVEEIGDVVAVAISEINAAASTLEARQPSAHTNRMVSVARNEASQLDMYLPVIREALRLLAEQAPEIVEASRVPLEPSEEAKRRGLATADA